MIKHPYIFFLPLILSGCMGIYEGGFECPPGEGTKCKSISEVNELINRRLESNPSMELENGPPMELEGRQQGCRVSPDLSDIPCTPPTPVFPATTTSEIWWSPWIHQEMESSPQSQRGKGYGT